MSWVASFVFTCFLQGKLTGRLSLIFCLYISSSPASGGIGWPTNLSYQDFSARQHSGCLENFLRSGRCYWFKVDPIAKSLNPLGEPINGIVSPPFVEVARSQLVIRFMTREHVKDTDHHGMGDRHDGALLASTCRQASIRGVPGPGT